jgi:large subunit ribosomal protein L19
MKAKNYTKETINQLGMSERVFPNFGIGDTVTVSIFIKEGEKKRVQDFQGDIIAIRNNGASSTFTIRKIGANSVAVERIFPYHSPIISDIKVVKKGDVRRAKLYYVRDRVGKAARIKEKILTKEQKLKLAASKVQEVASN